MRDYAEEPAKLEIEEIEIEERVYGYFAHRNKLEAARVVRMGPDGVKVADVEEIYTLKNETLFGQNPIQINISSIKAGLAARAIPFKLMRATLNPEWIQYAMATSGVEEDGIERQTPHDILRPGIMINWLPDNMHTTMVDGNHRMIARWRFGLHNFDFAFIDFPYIMEHVRHPKPDEQQFDLTQFIRSLRK